MPVFNERATVADAIAQVLEANPREGDFELVVVDDGSTDGTGDILEGGAWPRNVSVLTHAANRGKGAAIATGLGRACGRWTVIMDADLEYQPRDLDALV